MIDVKKTIGKFQKISDLNKKDGSTVDVMIDSKNNFKAIFY